MTTVSNLHTHTVYCDGKNTIDEMIQAALHAGFISLGFSGHCHTGFPDDVCQITDIDGYFNELEEAKRRYAGTITIFKGLELESRVQGGGRPAIDPRCDYTIGSDHLFWTKEGPYSVDYTTEEWNNALKVTGSIEKLMECYYEELVSFAEEVPFDIIGHVDLYTKFNEGGRPAIDPRCDYTIGSDHLFWTKEGPYSVDYTTEEWNNALKAIGSVEKLMECYYEELVSFAEEVPFDIIGHVDLYTKFNENGKMFDENLPKYKSLSLHYIERLAKTGKIFEVNTGAIGKGYRDTPYPSPFILKRLLELKAPIILSSDSHRTDTISCHFEETEKMLRDIGFREQMRLTENGFVAVSL